MNRIRVRVRIGWIVDDDGQDDAIGRQESRARASERDNEKMREREQER